MAQVVPQVGLSSPLVNMTTIGFGGETTVAVNPADQSNIVVTGAGKSNGDDFGLARVSSDAGMSWRYGNASLSYVNNTTHGRWAFYDSVGTFDADGDVYIGTLDEGGQVLSGAPIMSYLFKSTDGGNNFLLTSPFLRMNDTLLYYHNNMMVHPCIYDGGPARDFPAVIADSYAGSPHRNNVYVLVRTRAQISPDRCDYGTAFERSIDGGRTWGSGTWFSSNQLEFLADNRGMAVAPDGTVLLAGVGGSCLYIVNCPWSNCLLTDHNLALVLKSTDGGASFSRPLCAVDAPEISLESVEVAAISNSTIYVVYLGDNATLAPSVFHLYDVVSHDGGNNWSRPARIDDTTTPDYQHVMTAGGPFMWDFSLSQTGRLDVAWLDDRNNGGNYTLADIYYSYSYVGTSWAPDVRATTQGPFYICEPFRSVPTSCYGTGNDFMGVSSSSTQGSDKVYIVASMGRADCGSLCYALLTRFVTVTFPSPSVSVSGFFSDPGLNLLPSDSTGSPLVKVLLVGGAVRATSPSRVLAWIKVTNTGTLSLQSLKINEILPVDWSISPPWLPAKAAIRVYYASTSGLITNTEISLGSDVTVSTSNPETLHLSISSFNATTISHPLLPGEGILVSETLSYSLVRTSQSAASYPREYTNTLEAIAWTQPYYTGQTPIATSSTSFTADPIVRADPTGFARIATSNVHKYTVV